MSQRKVDKFKENIRKHLHRDKHDNGEKVKKGFQKLQTFIIKLTL